MGDSHHRRTPHTSQLLSTMMIQQLMCLHIFIPFSSLKMPCIIILHHHYLIWERHGNQNNACPIRDGSLSSANGPPPQSKQRQPRHISMSRPGPILLIKLPTCTPFLFITHQLEFFRGFFEISYLVFF